MPTSPSLTDDTRRGDETQVLLKLQGKGVSPADFTAIAQIPALLDDVVAAIIKHRLFATPEEQIIRLLEINEQVWKDSTITEAAIRAIGDPPDCPLSDESGLFCSTLFSETGNAVETFERNWLACRYVHGERKTCNLGSLQFTPQRVQLRLGAQLRARGLRWDVCELGRAFKGQKVEVVRPQLDRDRTKIMGMGQELPAVGAMHPRWAVLMNGNSIPFVYAPDLDVAPIADGRFDCVPCLDLNRHEGRVELYAWLVGDPRGTFGSGSLRQFRTSGA